VQQYQEEFKQQDPLYDWIHTYINQLFQEAYWIVLLQQFPDGLSYYKQHPLEVHLWSLLIPVVQGINEGYKPRKAS
jgi:hypothetical protein